MDKKAAIEATVLLAVILLLVAVVIGLCAGIIYLFGPTSIYVMVGAALLWMMWLGIYIDVKRRQ